MFRAAVSAANQPNVCTVYPRLPTERVKHRKTTFPQAATTSSCSPQTVDIWWKCFPRMLTWAMDQIAR